MQGKLEVRKLLMSQPLLLTLLGFSFAVGVFVGAGMGIFTSSSGKGDSFPETDEGTFRFIRTSAPTRGPGANRSINELKPFQYRVNSLIETAVNIKEASDIAVYFRDLNNGNWFGIREHDKFSPKSLLKVPLMIAYFKWAESSPVVMRRTLTFTGTKQEATGVRNKPGGELEIGKSYTVNDLIFRMIAHDDAESYTLLYAHMPPERLDKVYKDLYVEYDPQKQEDSLSLNAFAAFFRVLYNASYLSEEMSEKALRYLSRASLRTGMAAGVPPNIEIVCKQGERTITTASDEETSSVQQLHEFGIIYHPNRPFLLGVIARGNNADQLKNVIRDITRLVYEEVDKQS